MTTIQVRTRTDLSKLLADGLSPAWIISPRRLKNLTGVHVVNWDGTQRIEGLFDPDNSVWNHPDHPPGRLTIAYRDARIVDCDVKFRSRNPVAYIG